MDKMKKPKINWLLIVIVGIIAALLITVLVLLFSPKTQPKSFDYLLKHFEEAAKSTTDDIYFETIKINSLDNTIGVIFRNGAMREEYFVAASAAQANFLTSGNVEVREILQLANVQAYIQSIKPLNGTISWFTFMNKFLAQHPGYDASKAGLFGQHIVQENGFITFIKAIWFPALIAIIIFLGYKAQSRAASGGIFNPGKNQAVIVKTDKKFTDIAGNKEPIEEVQELVDYLKNPKKYAAAGARFPKGILLGGPPGTGKTLLAKATAGEANVPFFFISASSFVELYVGLGAKRVREMFKEARKLAPAIIFIDELDAVGRSRGSGIGGGNDEREQTLNQILVEMDGINENAGILIMGATNRTDVLDPALLRPGRFDRIITVGLPDIKEREEILKLHSKGKRLSKEIKFDKIAKRTPGYSGAQLENVINEASLLSVREKTDVIISTQIDEAIDRVMAGPAKKSRVISQEELKAVAYHEAGHAVVGLKVKGGNKVQKITIIPRGNAGGYNLMTPEEEKYNASKKELLATIASYMGGRAAEMIIYGKENISTGASDDISRATKIARKMVTEWGMSALGPIKYEEDTENPFLGRDYSKGTFGSKMAHEIDLEIRKIISASEEIAIKAIEQNLELLELIKDSLLENETIVAEEIEYIEKNMKLPPNNEKIKPDGESKKVNIEDLINQVNESQEKDKQKNAQIKEDLSKMDKKDNLTKAKDKGEEETLAEKAE
ncbi:ATP-dependent zinc metalloprotease FtsH [Mycoplasmopsis pulmonis]|uniref:ATP-dependent zinc metalloprotease FtsH n=1 Tax=Mycoplasmopsis pulmonis TaxID=2107 RepID=UPI00101CCE20